MEAVAAFAQVQTQLDHVARRFARKYHGDTNELRSIAFEAFVEAEAAWEIDYDRPWKTFVCNRAWWRMGAFGRREADWNQRHGSALDNNRPERTERGMGSLLSSLTEDAETVCRLVLEAPAELAEALRPDEPYSSRLALRRWLEGLGWTAERVVEAFREVREALS